MRANKVQHLLQDNDVKFWGNDIWPGNSPDLNVAECIGSIIKDEVETKMLSETEYNRYHEDTLKMYIENVLTSMEEDTELFETLLCSYPSRLRAVKNANGRRTDY
ncbi:unnamed protein product [Rotaria socialis]|uniref:Uncharacterized protein n=1 Tax=Rotaria socialis TaxID=392032 RepID=A0A819AMQ7_9BILA|nr:unnamed protein product [Rotaria socialis]CAF4680396.1 unnamed protein product [Rotaria socialis]